uniref:Basal body L-ring protein n=1 Tax=Fuerstiella marisgermanici TaxID=1891926 RepID=A0A1P8WA45_9PLAN|nr:flagellar basal body L-ring protein FlgH [Fuerstiella marisgermanici]APZ90935.1 Basal body L-ring protein [Fuerstiella marisgermanici]
MKRKPLTRRRILTLACAALAVPGMDFVRADSLWRRHRPQKAFLFEDSRARRPGDLVTIIINESTEVQNRENKALDKSTGASGTFDIAASSAAGFGDSAASAALDMSKSTDRNFSGQATYQNSREVTDRITVTVVSVTPAGNLVVCGGRTMSIAGEKRTLKISGMVRPVDIGPDNTVSSRFVANMQTSYDDSGAERHFTRQGWLGRKMNKIWPF